MNKHKIYGKIIIHKVLMNKHKFGPIFYDKIKILMNKSKIVNGP